MDVNYFFYYIKINIYSNIVYKTVLMYIGQYYNGLTVNSMS